MRINQKKRRCSFCGSVGRNVDFHPLSGLFLHYECWLTETRLNLRKAMQPRDYDAHGSTPETLLSCGCSVPRLTRVGQHQEHCPKWHQPFDQETLDLFE